MSYVDVPSLVVTVLAYLHIISAMAWLGGAILFVSTLAPATRLLRPSAELDFLATVVPKLSRYFLWAATSTVVFGPALLVTIPDYSPVIYVGVATGLTAYIIVLFEIPHFHKISRLAKETMTAASGTAPPADLQKALRRGRISTVTVLALLVTTLMFMVYSGYPF